NLILRIEPQNDTNGFARSNVVVEANAWTYDFVDIPVGATNLTVCVSGNTGPMELYLRKDNFPTQTANDKFRALPPPGGCLTISSYDLPPLQPGRYYIGVFNSSGQRQTINIIATVLLDINGVLPVSFTGAGGSQPILDDAVTNFTQYVSNNARIATLEV